MENKSVGYLLLGISALIMIMIFLFNNSIKNFIDNTCPYIAEGIECPAYTAINNQTYFSLAVIGVLILVGLFLIFSNPNERIIIKKVEKKNEEKKFDVLGLNSDEKKVFQFVKDNKAIFQAELAEKTEIGKVKMSRILDKLENRGLVERKRRGMNNVVILKD